MLVKLLEQAMLGERIASAVTHDEVVEQPHVHQCQGLSDAPGDALVGLAGVHHSGGVVVGDNQ